jgi:hypothetical protein
MANSYYNNDANTIIDGETIDASDVELKLDGVAAGFDLVAADMANTMQFTAADFTTNTVTADAATRANRLTGFDASGNPVLYPEADIITNAGGVDITGGTITGISSLGVSGDVTVSGTVSASNIGTAAAAAVEDFEPADATILKDADIGVSVASFGHDHSGTYEPADATILKDADIGVSVASFGHDHSGTYEPADATILKDADIGDDPESLVLHSQLGSSAYADLDDYEPADATILKDADIGVTVASESHTHDGVYDTLAVVSGGTAGYLWGTDGTDGVLRMGASMSWVKDAGDTFAMIDVAAVDGGTF